VRIGVNARRLEGQRLGVGRYIEYLVKHWAGQLAADEEVVLYVREPLRSADTLPPGISAEVVGPSLTGLAWENGPFLRAARGLDVLFCPSYTRPLLYRGRTVVAIHSMNEVESGTHPWWYRFTYTPLYRRSGRGADRVIVPSRSTLEDIRSAYGMAEAKLAVVPQGVDDSFGRVEDEDVLRATRERWVGSDRPFIVFVGKLSQRRNIPVLMRAFALAKERASLPHALLLMGPNHLGLPLDELARELGIEDSFVQTDGKVESHSELASLYSAADLYVSASAYEGFSITLVEALACGTPVVTINRAALSEIAAGAALLVDEPEPEQLADAIATVLTDEMLRSDLSERGLERAKAYQWRDAARATLEILREVAAR
jgi:glycosyltransferase involved in cell wall biosynthesis